MAAKSRNRVLDYTVYLVVRMLVCVLQAMPMSWAFACAEGLARLAYRVDRRHRAVAAENLRHAFPELAHNEAAIDQLVRGCYRHVCTLAVELVLIPRKLHLENWRRYASLVNGGPQLEGLLSPRPLLIVTAHFGNWEMAGYALGAVGFRTYAIARVLDNPYLERFLLQFRQKTGQTIIAKKDDFDRLTNVLQSGGKVATLADQDAGPRGVFVDFFGRSASAHKAVALMAIEFDAPMVVIGVPRVGYPMRYEIICEDRIDPRDYASRGDAVKAITQRYHAALERLIRRHPEQYFWLHRRWKSQPAARKARRDATQAA
ncbi:MAG: lysophospholipid acyltransferase family protein [Bacteroidales bacterium]|nr:lysophospholipid acyltransferase family protein [Bacteroidales bacterium]